MKYTFSIVLMLVLTGCGVSDKSSSDQTTALAPDDFFLAYGITPAPGLPQNPFYSAPGPQHSLTPIYDQPLHSGVLSKVSANYLYYGSDTQYDTVNSSWHPTKPGLYYIDEQVEFQGTYTKKDVTFFIQLNYTDNAYLWYSENVEVKTNTSIRKKMAINALICMNGNTDHVEALASVTGTGSDFRIISQESQFEGYYVGDCK